MRKNKLAIILVLGIRGRSVYFQINDIYNDIFIVYDNFLQGVGVHVNKHNY